MGRKKIFFWGGGFVAFYGKGEGSSSNTKSPGPRPSSMRSSILIHAAIWPQQIWAENWGGGLCSFGAVELGPRLTQCGQGRGLSFQVSSWSVQPFGHNTPKLETAGQTDRTGQWFDSIGRTVLQTVAQKHRRRLARPSCDSVKSLKKFPHSEELIAVIDLRNDVYVPL